MTAPSSTSCSIRRRDTATPSWRRRTVNPGGAAIVATFAADGPERCSGLPVRRYDAEALAEGCGPEFLLMGSVRHIHHTPAGIAQSFQYATFERVALG